MFHEEQFQDETLLETLYFWVMARKKWTPKEEVTDSVLLFREKRKWQIALRRYILEQKWGAGYAPFFGLDSINFRKWIELQFDEGTDWDNFSTDWQFDHIVPVAYFDFRNEADLRLCWNFTNIRIEKLALNKKRGHRVDVLASKAYFERLFEQTQYPICREMVRKIEEIEVSEIGTTASLEEFIRERRNYLGELASFSAYEFSMLNQGVDVAQILAEREFLRNVKH